MNAMIEPRRFQVADVQASPVEQANQRAIDLMVIEEAVRALYRLNVAVPHGRLVEIVESLKSVLNDIARNNAGYCEAAEQADMLCVALDRSYIDAFDDEAGPV